MVKETKLYDLLGVSPSSSDAEIKKGYRKMALKYHPDKPTGDTEKFKEVSEAFQILSDGDKREVYDQYGLEAARGNAPAGNPFAGQGGAGGAGGAGGPGGSFRFNSTGAGGHPFTQADAFNIFNQFGGFEDIFGGGGSARGGSPFGGMGGGMGGGMHGGMPGGMGGNMGGAMPGGFNGMGGGMSGQSRKRPEPEVVDLNVPCSLEELYKGGVKKLKIKRKGPSGQTEEKIIEINLKPGWKAGTKISYPNEGDYRDGMRQTLRMIIAEKPHPVLKREDNNLRAVVELSFKESLLGFTKGIETLSGRKLHLNRSSPTQPGLTETFPSQGMPISKQPGKAGDLIVEYKVDYPIYLNSTQKEAISSNF